MRPRIAKGEEARVTGGELYSLSTVHLGEGLSSVGAPFHSLAPSEAVRSCVRPTARPGGVRRGTGIRDRPVCTSLVPLAPGEKEEPCVSHTTCSVFESIWSGAAGCSFPSPWRPPRCRWPPGCASTIRKNRHAYGKSAGNYIPSFHRLGLCRACRTPKLR